MRRINAACFAVVNFVSHRTGDRIGLIMFNDAATWLLPLWFDQKVVIRQAGLINSHGTSGGTNFDGPSQSNSALGPLQAGINHLVAYGQGNSKVMIMVTDGEDSMSDQRRAELAEQFAKFDIHLYVLGVGPGWLRPDPNGGPDLRRLADAVNGKVFVVKDGDSLKAAFEEINRLEPSKIHREVAVKHHELAPLPLFAAVILILVFLPFSLLMREQA
jgi:Ca-activated chloride channel family protein